MPNSSPLSTVLPSIPTDLISPRTNSKQLQGQSYKSSGHSSFVFCGFKEVIVLELLCDGQCFFPLYQARLVLSQSMKSSPYTGGPLPCIQADHMKTACPCSLTNHLGVRRLFLGNVLIWRNKLDQLILQQSAPNSSRWRVCTRNSRAPGSSRIVSSCRYGSST